MRAKVEADLRGDKIVLANKPHLGFTLKDDESRQIPIEEELVSLIASLPAEGPVLRNPRDRAWTRHHFTHEWAKVANVLHLPPEKRKADGNPRYGASLHALRHTYASIQIQEKGVDIYTLMRRMGHSDIKTAEGCFHLFSP